MINLLINYATLLAFIAFSVDLLYQIRNLIRKKSSKSVSLFGLTARTIGTLVLLIKYVKPSDVYLISGQVFFMVLITIYLWLAYRYRKQ
jgi:uncharacterized protein with PQ loop repeat